MNGSRARLAMTERARGLGLLFAIALLGIAVRLPAATQRAAANQTKTITLGLIAEMNQKEVEEHFRPFVRYVAAKISLKSSIEGRIVVVSTQARLANLLREKNADFYMESPYPTYQINSVRAAGKLLLRRWKGGMAEYRTLIFAKKGNAIKNLDDLRGKTIAFEDPESTSGYFLPKLLLSRKGYRLVSKSQLAAKVPLTEIGYFFAGTQDKLMDLVLTQRVAAGAFSNDDYAALDSEKKSQLVIIAETASLPRHLVSVRRDLPNVVTTRLKNALLSMHQDPQGRAILEKLDGTTKFDTFPGGEAAISQRLLDVFYSPEKH